MSKQKNIKGFKGYDKDMKCRNKQYEEGKEYSEDVNPKACSTGMHFCEMPLDVFNYYPPQNGNVYTTVESIGDVHKKEDKVSTNKLKVGGKISIPRLFKIHFEIINSKIKSSTETSSTTGEEAHSSTTGNYAHSSTTGEEAHSSTTGNYAHSSTTGYKAHSSTTGEEAHSSTTGEEAHSSTTGEEAHSSTTGYKAHSSTTGYKAHSSTTGEEAHSSTTGYKAHSSTTGNYAHSSTTGEEAISSALGIRSKVSAEKGWIILVDWKQDESCSWAIRNIYRAKVGKHKIKGVLIESNVKYWFENGELKSES